MKIITIVTGRGRVDLDPPLSNLCLALNFVNFISTSRAVFEESITLNVLNIE